MTMSNADIDHALDVERTEVCGIYATIAARTVLQDVIEAHKRWGSGYKFDGDMLAIGQRHNIANAVPCDLPTSAGDPQ